MGKILSIGIAYRNVSVLSKY